MIESQKSLKTNLSSVSGDHLIRSVVTLQREVDLENVVAGLDDPQDAVDLHALHALVNTHLSHVVNLVEAIDKLEVGCQWRLFVNKSQFYGALNPCAKLCQRSKFN